MGGVGWWRMRGGKRGGRLLNSVTKLFHMIREEGKGEWEVRSGEVVYPSTPSAKERSGVIDDLQVFGY